MDDLFEGVGMIELILWTSESKEGKNDMLMVEVVGVCGGGDCVIR